MEQIVSAEKTCSKCGEAKSVDEFYKDSHRKDGLQAYCKSCDIARNKAWREANRERRLEYGREYYAANLDRQRAYRRAYDAKQRLKTLDALESLSPCPTDAEVISALSGVYTNDASPICKLADNLLSLAHCGAEEHEAKAEIMAEADDEWFAEQRAYQHNTIQEYNNEYPEYALA